MGRKQDYYHDKRLRRCWRSWPGSWPVSAREARQPTRLGLTRVADDNAHNGATRRCRILWN